MLIVFINGYEVTPLCYVVIHQRIQLMSLFKESIEIHATITGMI